MSNQSKVLRTRAMRGQYLLASSCSFKGCYSYLQITMLNTYAKYMVLHLLLEAHTFVSVLRFVNLPRHGIAWLVTFWWLYHSSCFLEVFVILVNEWGVSSIHALLLVNNHVVMMAWYMSTPIKCLLLFLRANLILKESSPDICEDRL